MEPDGEEVKVRVEAGTSILDAARDHDIELEAACEGELACSTCHVILPEDEFNAHFSDIEEEEEDMLDLAWGLTDTSRLGCQVLLTTDVDGMRIMIPEESSDLR